MRFFAVLPVPPAHLPHLRYARCRCAWDTTAVGCCCLPCLPLLFFFHYLPVYPACRSARCATHPSVTAPVCYHYSLLFVSTGFYLLVGCFLPPAAVLPRRAIHYTSLPPCRSTAFFFPAFTHAGFLMLPDGSLHVSACAVYCLSFGSVLL